MNFKVGDIVEAFGLSGIVEAIGNSYGNPPVVVRFEGGETVFFLPDGKYCDWHKEPSLKLIERSKNKVKKTIEGWINIFPNKDPLESHLLYSSKEQADVFANKKLRIACVKVIGEYEVEE